jgi:UDP-glucose 4-epimerase
VKDTVRAVIELAATPKAVGEIFNVGSQEEITIAALAERIQARTGSSSALVRVPYDQAYEKGFEDMLRRVPSIDKIRAAIEWEPTFSLDQTLDEVIRYFRAVKPPSSPTLPPPSAAGSSTPATATGA